MMTLPSKPTTLDIMSSRIVEPLNNLVFDKLIIETSQELNNATYNILRNEHKDQMGYSPREGRDRRRFTFQTPSNPFTLIIYGNCIRIDFNPNRYGNYERCHQFLVNLIRDFDPQQTTVKAIDLNVDLGLNYDVVVESIVVSNIRKCVIESYSSTKTKLKLGHDKSQFSIYNKAYFEKCPDIAWTRIERRYGSYKCPIENLSQIYELSELHPFEQASFHQLSAFEPETLSEFIKWCGIFYFKSRYGMQSTKKLLSRDGQFRRWEKYLEEVKPFCLDDFYKVNMEKFLGDGIN